MSFELFFSLSMWLDYTILTKCIVLSGICMAACKLFLRFWQFPRMIKILNFSLSILIWHASDLHSSESKHTNQEDKCLKVGHSEISRKQEMDIWKSCINNFQTACQCKIPAGWSWCFGPYPKNRGHSVLMLQK